MLTRAIIPLLAALLLMGSANAILPSHPTEHPAHALWTQEPVADDVVVDVMGLAVDPDLRAHVAFSRGGTAYYSARQLVAGWAEETVALEGIWPDLVLDADDGPHIAYRVGFSNVHATAYGSRSGTLWVTELVDGVHGGGNNRIQLDGAGTPHIVYGGSGAIRYASKLPGGWELEIIAAEPANIFGFDLDASGNAHVVYHPTGSTLRYATNTGGSWVVTTFPAAGGFPDLVIDATGDVHVTFQSTSGRLGYARLSSGAWQIEDADSDSWTGQSASIDVDSHNRPHITYSDQYGSDSPFGAKSRYATRLDDGTWSTSVVGSIGITRGGSELRIGADDIPRVLYPLGYTQGVTTNVDRLVLATQALGQIPST